MPYDPPEPTRTRRPHVLDVRHVLPLPRQPREDAAEPVGITVVGSDVAARNRVMELLARTPGLRVVGWAESVEALTMLGMTSQICLAVGPDPASPAAADGGAPAPAVVSDVPRPHLSSRQRDVLAAYGAGNELLDVVARRLGMGTETLKTHLRRIRAKYEAAGRPAPTRRDLYVRAIEDGLVPPPR